MRRRERFHAIATCLAVLLTAPIEAAAASEQDRAFSDAVARVRRHSAAERHPEAHALAESLCLATEARELAVAHAFILRYRPDAATCALADQALRARERRDRPARLWMLAFYSSISRGASAAEAAFEVSRSMLTLSRAGERAEHPADWDAFMVVGGLA